MNALALLLLAINTFVGSVISYSEVGKRDYLEMSYLFESSFLKKKQNRN